jgi:hypothetical protein
MEPRKTTEVFHEISFIHLWSIARSNLRQQLGRTSRKGEMKKTDVTCSECGAGFVRIEIDAATDGSQGVYHCSACGHLLEQVLDGKLVAYRMTVRPNN